jgi:UMF1 family MFS transporter
MSETAPATVESRRPIVAWALYDWANSAFATAILAGFFPVYYKEYWSTGIAPTVSSYYLGLTTATASLIVLALAPTLGAIADQGAYKKRFLGLFTLLGAGACAAMAGLSAGEWLSASALYVLGGVGFGAAIIFYDALLVDITVPQRYDVVSGFGYGAGYLGGGLFFLGCVLMAQMPTAFGLADAGSAVRVAFPLTGLWWIVFTAPLLVWVRERPAARPMAFWRAARAGLAQLVDTFHKLRRYRTVMWFLAAYWLYIDGVDTIVRMAVDYGIALGFDSEDLIKALLLTQFVAFPAALAFGWLGARVGAKPGILLGLAVYVGVTLWAYRLTDTWEFYGIAAVIGCVQGGVQSLSRSLYARLIPADCAGEFFGFYNLLGKFAAILGPVLMGWIALATGNTRTSILGLLLLFGLGAVILTRVDTARAAPRA